MSTRSYYAVWYRYDNAISSGDILARFDTRAERDEFCSRAREDYAGAWEPVTLAGVRHRFNVREFESNPRTLEEYTSAGHPVRYINQRDGYNL